MKRLPFFEATVLEDVPFELKEHVLFRASERDGPTRHTHTWNYFHQSQNLNSHHTIPKGIMTVEDAQLAADIGAKAIILSNHGGRQLDSAPSLLEVTIKIHE